MYCVKCGVRLGDGVRQCPLCQTPVWCPDETVKADTAFSSAYPAPPRSARYPVLAFLTVICAAAITSSAISMCGQVGWVGLLIPHMCRMKFGSNHLALIPSCVSIGAVFMIAVDTAARSMSASEIPVSILTAVIGAPFFILLMRRSGGWQF